MKKIKLLKFLIVLTVMSLGLISYQPVAAQENPEDLTLCNGPEGSVEDPYSQACVIRDCDCNRTANNGKVGELICMEARTVKNDEGQTQYVCKFPNSPTGASCDTVGIQCPGASSDTSSSIDAGATPAQTQDPAYPAVQCEEKLLQWDADRQCDSQYNRLVTLDRWQSAVFDPDTGRCKEFFLPNMVLQDQVCGAGAAACEQGPVDVSCKTKVCLADGAEACQETWRDSQCNVSTRVGRLTGQQCKVGTATVDVTSAVQTAVKTQLPSEAQEFGINITLGFRDRSTVRGYFTLKIAADETSIEPKTIWDIAAVWLDGTRFTLNPNNYHESNFNLSNLNSDVLVYALTTKVSEQTREEHPKVTIEFSDGSTRTGTLDIKIEPGWVGTTGPKTIEQMLNTLEKVTITNPYTGEHFTLDRGTIMQFAQATFPGQIVNEEAVYSVTIPLQFRDGSKLTSNATFTLKKAATQDATNKTIWDISGVEINGWNLTLNPDNIQPNNFTFWQNPDVITEALKLEVPTRYTEIPIKALVKFSDGSTRDAELEIILEPSGLTSSSPRTVTEALSNIQMLTLIDPYNNIEYRFDSESIKNNWGTIVKAVIPEGETAITLPIKANFPGGAFRSDTITIVYRP